MRVPRSCSSDCYCEQEQDFGHIAFGGKWIEKSSEDDRRWKGEFAVTASRLDQYIHNNTE
jgi:hypothetical protein